MTEGVSGNSLGEASLQSSSPYGIFHVRVDEMMALNLARPLIEFDVPCNELLALFVVGCVIQPYPKSPMLLRELLLCSAELVEATS